MTSHSDLEKLQAILFGNGRAELSALKQRVEDTNLRSDDIAEVFPDVIRKTEDSPVLPQVLSEPVTAALRVSITRSPEQISNLLFPVILPAIRKSIEHTLQSFMESMDLMVKQRFSLQSLMWRVESWRTGIPFTDIMLRNLLKYEAEQIFLIQRNSGLLIGHVHTPDAVRKDSDAVSAMLTAIESFVKESFSDNEENELNRVTVGDRIVYLEHGPYASIASVVRGVAPPEYRTRLKQVNADLHASLDTRLRDFSGNREELPFLDEQLLQGLEREYQPKRKSRVSTATKLKLFAILFAAMIMVTVGYFIYRQYESGQVKAMMDELTEKPGIITSRAMRDNRHWTIFGLRDPDAAPISGLTDQYNMTDKVDFSLEPYISLDPEIVLRRASRSLNIPSGVEARLHDSELQLSGSAPLDWYLSLAANRSMPLVGITTVNDDGLDLAPDEISRLFETRLHLPGQVETRGSNNGLRVIIHGTLTTQDKAELARLAALLQRKVTIVADKASK